VEGGGLGDATASGCCDAEKKAQYSTFLNRARSASGQGDSVTLFDDLTTSPKLRSWTMAAL